MDLAKLEIKMFVLVKKLSIYYDGKMERVEDFLHDVLTHRDSSPTYINQWLDTRYVKIGMSKETQVMMMRHAGFTYRQIALFVHKAPNTIKEILDMYDFNYSISDEDREQLELILQRWNALENSMKGMGLKII